MNLQAAVEHYAPHHEELRKRLISCFIAITVTSVVSYLFINQIVAFCMQPLHTAYPALQKLVYTKLTEAFITYLKLSLLTGILVSFPVLIYQAWMFIAPGLMDNERKLARQAVFWSSFLFGGGALFAFFVALPRILNFFMSYAGPNLEPMPKLALYLTFVARMTLAFGIAFEIPFLMFMAAKSGLISRDYFRKKRIYFYIAIVVLSFLLTAGELMATMLLSFPLFGLYETGIILGRIFIRDKEEKGPQEPEEKE